MDVKLALKGDMVRSRDPL